MHRENSNFASLVKMVRTELGLTQEEFARELGVSFPTLNRWENGQVNPSRLGRAQFDAYCGRMKRRNKLTLDNSVA